MASFASTVSYCYPLIQNSEYRKEIFTALQDLPQDKTLSNFELFGCESRDCFYCHESCDRENQTHRPLLEQVLAYFAPKVSIFALKALSEVIQKEQEKRIRAMLDFN